MGPLKNTAATFSQKANNYLLDVFWMGEETTMTIAFNLASQIKSFEERHRPELLSKTDWSIEQQIT